LTLRRIEAADSQGLPRAVTSWLSGQGGWWMLAAVIAVGLLGNWLLAAGMLALLLFQIIRPFDFTIAFLLVTAGSTFVNYLSGTLTAQLSLLSAGIMLMLLCYLVSKRGEVFSLALTDLTWPLAIYVLLSAANAGRGLMAGYPTKHIFIELLPVLELGSALLLANAFVPRRDLRVALIVLLGVAYTSAARGYHVFSIIHTHTAGVFFQPIPGIVALLLVNLALRAKSLEATLGWIALSLPLFLHQFLSFGRGIWLGNLVGLLASILIFAVGREGGARWVRSGLVLGTILGVGMLGAVALSVLYGQVDILLDAGARFLSIGGTKLTPETRSNVTRLLEYATVAEHIQRSPWVGHGLGYTFFVDKPLYGKAAAQWWVHQNYLLVWLKQGVIGLVLFLVMLWTALRFSIREARRREDPWESGWFAATAVSTIFLAVFSLSDFPFDGAEAMFLLALFWGGSMAMARVGLLRFAWSSRPAKPVVALP
jgi:hypothetical protein